MSDILSQLKACVSEPRTRVCDADIFDAIDEIERLRAELSAAIKQRDEARREAMQWWRERFSTKEFKEEVGQRGWEYLLVEGGGA